MELVDLMKALGDENRLRILNLLRNGELNVGDMENILGISQSNISRHLSRLRNSKLIKHQKQAQWVFYNLNENTLSQYPLIKEVLDHELDKIDQCIKDLEKLKEYHKRGKKLLKRHQFCI